MPDYKEILRYCHTFRYLRPRQVLYQVRRKIWPPRLATLVENPPKPAAFALIPWPSRPSSYNGSGLFRFLNQEYDCGWPPDWRAPGLSHLWRYNLHYFDYLHQPGMDQETALALIRHWMEHYSPQSEAVGWEPYALSLRLVNWIKYFSDRVPSNDIIYSIALQAENLRIQIEYHILGNHLVSDAKALWFAGTFLRNDRLRKLGRHIILSEVKEQFLPDGGHFELTPMYQSIMVEHLLDLINLCQSDGNNDDKDALPGLIKAASQGLGWLGIITDAQGDFPLLSDSAHGGSTHYTELLAYARRLGVQPNQEQIPRVTVGEWEGFFLSGYWVMSHNQLRLIFDTALLGPDYLPGHAHCDMLSVLLDINGKSIFADTGIYEYAEGRRRMYSRNTAAHNTVMLDGLEQADCWKSFRMGLRGHPRNIQQEGQTIRCSHTGFAIWQRGLYHERELALRQNGFDITDHLRGPSQHNFQAFFHCHPDVQLKSTSDGNIVINDCLYLEPWGAQVNISSSEYYPEFGVVLNRPCLILNGSFFRRGSFGLKCTFFS